jgi:hypothetical protein
LEGRLGRLVHLLEITLFALVIVLCLVLAYRRLNLESFVTLTAFNLFFISLFFWLSGSLTRKAVILTCGNILGLIWNYIFLHVAATGSGLFGISFDVFFSVIYPLLTLTWIVPFLSLSLSVLPNPHRGTKPST